MVSLPTVLRTCKTRIVVPSPRPLPAHLLNYFVPIHPAVGMSTPGTNIADPPSPTEALPSFTVGRGERERDRILVTYLLTVRENVRDNDSTQRNAETMRTLLLHAWLQHALATHRSSSHRSPPVILPPTHLHPQDVQDEAMHGKRAVVQTVILIDAVAMHGKRAGVQTAQK